MPKIKVLVTGAGSGVGQGIMKALRLSKLPITLIAADVSPLSAGLYRADEGVLIPKVESTDALKKIISVLRKTKPRVVMIGSEFDLMFFSKHKRTIEDETGAVVIVSPLSTVSLANDKFKTAEFLKENKLPYAESVVPESLRHALETGKKWKWPVILKSRSGTSARQVFWVRDSRQMQAAWPMVQDPVVQKILKNSPRDMGSEYTCSVFRCADRTLLGPFVARRILRNGHSWIMEVKNFPKLKRFVWQLGQKMDVMGPLNIQLMLTERGPVPFEFNCRFSGTTAVRAHFGFNEPEMAVRSYLLKEKLRNPKIQEGMALRYNEEVFMKNVSFDELKPPFKKGEVPRWF